MRVHFLGSMMTESLFSSCWADYLVKSGGTGVVTKDCMGFRWTCWNMSRISGLFEISSLLLQEWSCSQTHTENKKTIWFTDIFHFMSNIRQFLRYVAENACLNLDWPTWCSTSCRRDSSSSVSWVKDVFWPGGENCSSIFSAGVYRRWAVVCVGVGGLSASVHSVPINISYIAVLAAVIKRCIVLCILCDYFSCFSVDKHFVCSCMSGSVYPSGW